MNIKRLYESKEEKGGFLDEVLDINATGDAW